MGVSGTMLTLQVTGVAEASDRGSFFTHCLLQKTVPSPFGIWRKGVKCHQARDSRVEC